MFQIWQKNNALCHISSSISLEKRSASMKAFIESQFNYCPLIWILRSRTLKNKISHIHERALRTIIHLSMNSLIKMITLRFIKKNVQNLAIEIYKYLHGLSPAILSDVFKVNKTAPYDLRMRNEL